ncbi:MAG: hypothetical protein XD88_1747 [Methanocalculus sp. 52_23]|nr:MAG: hypothetical protein XD88_1747 [Methanocalculus sp. 52_23]
MGIHRTTTAIVLFVLLFLRFSECTLRMMENALLLSSFLLHSGSPSPVYRASPCMVKVFVRLSGQKKAKEKDRVIVVSSTSTRDN